MDSICSGKDYADRSWEVFEKMCDKVGVKAIAAALKMGYPTVCQWTNDPETTGGSGRRNPLDRLDIIRKTLQESGCQDESVMGIRWLAERAGYILVKKTATPTRQIDNAGYLNEVLRFTVEAGDVPKVFSDSMADGILDVDEKKQILKELKDVQEQAARLEILICSEQEK